MDQPSQQSQEDTQPVAFEISSSANVPVPLDAQENQVDEEIINFFEFYRLIVALESSVLCPVCSKERELPMVILHCRCEYHLHCFNDAKTMEHCMRCHDKINKTCDDDYQLCAICLEIIKGKDQKLSCNHRFHAECIQNWQLSLQTNNNRCPVCRECILYAT